MWVEQTCGYFVKRSISIRIRSWVSNYDRVTLKDTITNPGVIFDWGLVNIYIFKLDMNEQLHSHKTIDHYGYLSIPLSKLNQIIRRDRVTYVINSRRPFSMKTKLLEPFGHCNMI